MKKAKYAFIVMILLIVFLSGYRILKNNTVIASIERESAHRDDQMFFFLEEVEEKIAKRFIKRWRGSCFAHV